MGDGGDVKFWLVGGVLYTLLPVLVAAVWLWRGLLAGVVARVAAVAVGGHGLFRALILSVVLGFAGVALGLVVRTALRGRGRPPPPKRNA